MDSLNSRDDSHSGRINRETKAIVVHPWWHRLSYLIIAAVLAAFTYIVLTNLTGRINAAEDGLDNAQSAITERDSALDALADQVKGLGATPVVNPSDIPDPQMGPSGPAGAAGPSGAPGQDGEDGQDGQDGQSIAGPSGAAGASGAPGASVTGSPGQPGPTGPPGPAGPTGANGKDGKDGQDGADSTVAGPQGPVGPAGPAGQTCPSGYNFVERNIITAENPLGEPGFVCVAQSNAPAGPDTPVSQSRKG